MRSTTTYATRTRGQSGKVAVDTEGRVFVVRESSATVVVLSPGLDGHVHTIELDVEGGPDRRARRLLDDENAGPEGILHAGGRPSPRRQAA